MATASGPPSCSPCISAGSRPVIPQIRGTMSTQEVPVSLDSAAAGRLKGALATVVAIPVTPFGASGDVDWEAHAGLIRRLTDGGVSVVTPNGNTGEFYALT